MSLVANHKVGFNYEILEKYSAGIELFGYEVKSLKSSHGSLEGSHVTIRGGEAYIVGMFIPPYQVGNTPAEYDPYRNRKLLLSKKEIAELASIEKKAGLTIVPISVYNKVGKTGGKIGLDIASAKGKKKFDKRETLKKRDSERDIQREFKDR